MGRIKSQAVKRDGLKIYQTNPELFTESFEENKKKVEEVAKFNSKKLRNVIAGYVTRLVKKSKEEEVK